MIPALEAVRNEQRATITWQFTVEDARRKLYRLYPAQADCDDPRQWSELATR
jgi:hypothetical protein